MGKLITAIERKTPKVSEGNVRTFGLTLKKGISCFIRIFPAIENLSLFKVYLCLDENDMPGTGTEIEMEELLPLKSIPANIGIPSLRDFLFKAQDQLTAQSALSVEGGPSLDGQIFRSIAVDLASLAEVEISMDGSIQLCAELKIGEFFGKRTIKREEIEEFATFDGEGEEELL
ncbi:MAG: hypothetical protein ABSF47_03015 [Minisyncoccia bacterium]|jgi:hypothetical protein